MGWSLTVFVGLHEHFGLEIRVLFEAELLVLRDPRKTSMGELSTATVGAHVYGRFVQWLTAARASGCPFPLQS